MSPSDLHVGGLLEHRAIDTLHHRLQLLHGPHFVELRDARCDHRLDGGLPEHRLRQLPDKQRDDRVRGAPRVHRGSTAVHVDVALGRLHPHGGLPQRGLDLGGCRLHERCVEGARAGDELGLERAVGLDQLLELLHGGLAASTSGALREKGIRNVADGARAHLVPNLLAEALELVSLQSGNRQQCLRPAVGGRLRHGLRPDLHDLQSVFEGHDAGGHECSILTNTEARHCSWPACSFGRLLLQLLQSRQACNEHDRVADVRLLEL
mmetsp:Transcript_23043/g.62814  ORF Transcript_23043/g.62814 Transcript_23043/m.62814 type:complete len:265 (+) Transcript_23043:182-976(+)